MKRLILIIIFCIFANQLFALNYGKVIKNSKANRKYNEEEFEFSEKLHKENSIEYPDDTNIHFNLGDAYYKTEKYEEAITEYINSLRDDRVDKSNAYYNIGNSCFQQQDYIKALENYKNSLIHNPRNIDAKYNYELTKQFLQMQQEQEGQGQNQQSDKDKEKQDQEQQDKKDQEKEDEEEQQQQQDSKDEQDQQDQTSEEELKQAERILDAMQRAEDENQKERIKQLLKQLKLKPVEKNW
ncbi:MAG: tetratricopeptide repeat protein [Candidatus Cloacimonetes bacterium]|nr:tetratricopeptide repeat protein [Candidatus Cloacimonadota bacterium]